MAPIDLPRAISGWTMTLRARIDRTMPASSSISPVDRRRATGSVRSSMRIGLRVRTARAAGRLEPTAVGKSRIASSVAWASGSPLTAATRRSDPSGSTRSITHQSASSGIARTAAASTVSERSIDSSRRSAASATSRVRTAPRVNSSCSRSIECLPFVFGCRIRPAARRLAGPRSLTQRSSPPARAGALLTHSPDYGMAGCHGSRLAVSLHRRSPALHTLNA